MIASLMVVASDNQTYCGMSDEIIIYILSH